MQAECIFGARFLARLKIISLSTTSTHLQNSRTRSITIGILFVDVVLAVNLNHSTTSDYVLRALPTLSADYQAQADKLTIPFTGDPSFFAFFGEEAEPEPEDPEAPPVERFREVHRLSSTVKVD